MTPELDDRSYQCQVDNISDGDHSLQMVLSLQEVEDAVAGEVGVVGIVLQGMTWGVVSRGTLSGGPNIEHLYSTNRRGGD